MDQPKIPTLKDSQKPQVKIRGLEAGVTLFDRLKQFKKKDLAFILAGLGTLFMAPLAEHFMMAPEAGDASLQPGWGGKGGAGSGNGIFNGSGSSPYEPGAGGMAPGGAIGGGSDVITPLNVRDPSALVMGPGATQQPPAGSAAPSTPPPTAPASHNDTDLKDALAASAARGVGAAAKAAKAVLPVPKVALNGSALHGLGAVSGGSSTSAGLGGVSSNGLGSNKATTGGGGTNLVRPTSGYKGVARGQSSGGGGLDALKAAADKQAGEFNRGKASDDLNNAAATSIPNGGTGTGGGGAGGSMGTDKGFGGDQNKDGKNVGESLAFLKAKAMQEAKIALWAKEQEAGDSKLEMLKIRNSMAEAVAGSLGKALGDFVSCPISQADNGGLKGLSCFQPSAPPTSANCYIPGDSATNGTATVISGSQLVAPGKCTTASGGSTSTKTKELFYIVNGVAKKCSDGSTFAVGCNKDSGDGKGSGDGNDNTNKGGFAKPTGDQSVAISNLGQLCSDIEGFGGNGGIQNATATSYLTALKTRARAVVAIRSQLGTGNADDQTCKGGKFVATEPTVTPAPAAKDVTDKLTAKAILEKSAKSGQDSLAAMKAAVAKEDYKDGDAIPGAELLDNARKQQASGDQFVTNLDKSLDGVFATDPGALPTDVMNQLTATDKAKVAAWPTQVKNAKDGLKTEIGSMKTESSGLAAHLKEAGYAAIPGEDKTPPTMAGVLTNNAAFAQVKKDIAPITLDAAAPSVKNPADVGPTRETVKSAKTAIGDTAGTDPMVDAKSAAGFYKAHPTETDAAYKPYSDPAGNGTKTTFSDKAKTGPLKAANDAVASMQGTQSAWIDQIAKQITTTTGVPASSASSGTAPDPRSGTVIDD